MKSNRPTVHVLYPHRWHVEQWAKKNAEGLEPDKYQYGFNRLEQHGFRVTYAHFPQGGLLQKVGSLCARLCRYTFDPFYFLFQIKHLRKADVIINPLDPQGFTICWLRQHGMFGLSRKKHIFVAVWLPGYVQACSPKQLERFRRLLSTVDICMYYCESARKILQEYLDLPDEKLKKFYFGVDADFYTEMSAGEDDFILTAGNDSYRDFDMLADVFRSLEREKLYIASSIQIKSEVPPNINYLQLTYNRELLDYYRKAKIIIIPLKKDCPTSSGSSVLMECMHLGKPVIASRTAYMQETVGKQQNVLLVEPGNAQAMTDAIRALSEDNGMRRELGRKAREQALQYFSTERCMQRIAETARALLTAAEDRKKIVHILYPSNWDVDAWRAGHAGGLLPDRFQLGYDRLEKYGFRVAFTRYPQSPVFKKIGNLCRRIIKYGPNPFCLAYSLRKLRQSDILISPLDHEGLTLCWLRMHRLFGLHKKRHIFIHAWLSAWALKATDAQLGRLRKLMATVDVLACFGEADKEIFKDILNIPEEKLFRISYGVDKDFYVPHSVSREDFILAPGNDAFRDFVTLAAVAAEMPEQQFIITSEGRVDLGCLPPNLSVMHLKSHKELREMYLKARAVVVPIKYGCVTASGVTVLNEALLLGSQIIVSSTGIMAEIASGLGERVIQVEPEDKNALRDAIMDLQVREGPPLLAPEERQAHSSEHYIETLAAVIERLQSRKVMPTIHVILPHHYRIKDWIRKHAAGLVPGEMQYDLLRLAKYGLSVTYHESSLLNHLKRLSRFFRLSFGFSGLHILQQIIPMLQADCVFTRLDPEGLIICLLRKMRLFNLHRRPHIFKVSWLPGYLEAARGARRRWLISLLKTVDLFVVGSPCVKDYIQSHCDIPDERFSYHAHGIDIDFFRPAAEQTGDFILCVGNDRHRDFDVLNKISDRISGNTKLIVASELHKLADQIRETERLMFVQLSHVELRDYYNRARLVIIPIRKECVTDSGITTLKEAMVMGKAVIASATLFMQEIVQDGVNGLLVEPGSPDALIDSINYLLDNPGACRQMGAEASKSREAFSTSEQLKGLSQDIIRILDY